MKTLDVSTMESVKGGDGTVVLLCQILGTIAFLGSGDQAVDAANAFESMGCAGILGY
jgi:hypothetical protein